MKECANCGRQNGDEANFCSGCGKPLQEQPSPAEIAGATTAGDPVVVATFDNPQEALVLKSELEAVGIEAYVPEEYAESVFSAVAPFQTASVRVPASQAEAARAIAAAFAPGSRPLSEAAEKDENVPPGPADTGRGGPEVVQTSTTSNPSGMTRCVSCAALIPLDSVLCPKCGNHQPRLA